LVAEATLVVAAASVVSLVGDPVLPLGSTAAAFDPHQLSEVRILVAELSLDQQLPHLVSIITVIA
jgi:hypothetical protein